MAKSADSGRPVLPPEKARQGRWGSNVLMVLIAALILAMIAWFGAEMFGQADVDPNTQTGTGGQAEEPAGSQSQNPAASPAPSTTGTTTN